MRTSEEQNCKTLENWKTEMQELQAVKVAKMECVNLADPHNSGEKQSLTVYNGSERKHEQGQNKRKYCKTAFALKAANAQKKTAAPIAVGNGGYLRTEEKILARFPYLNSELVARCRIGGAL